MLTLSLSAPDELLLNQAMTSVLVEPEFTELVRRAMVLSPSA